MRTLYRPVLLNFSSSSRFEILPLHSFILINANEPDVDEESLVN
jgi:hypothetical protein